MWRVVTVAAAAWLIFVTTQPASAQTTYPAVLACWTLDEASGPRVDESDNSYHLTDNNTVGSVTGVIGNAAQFARSNSEWLSLNSNLSIADDTAWSFSAWVWLDSVGTYPAFYGNSISAKTRFWMSNSSTIRLHNDSNVAADFTESIATGSWKHLVIVASGADSNNMVLYVNGVPETAVTLADSSQTVSNIGRINAGAFYYHDGRIDEPVFFDGALTADQVTALYNGGSGVGCSDILGSSSSGAAAVRSLVLPSGATATVTMDASAGELLIILCLIGLVFIFLFDLLREMAHVASKR